MLRLLAYMMLLFLLTACAGNRVSDLSISLGLTSEYKVAQTAFHQGLIMDARKHLLRIKESDKDYAAAQRFLKEKVEPARLKLLRYYARKGKAEEKKRHWAKAEEAYRMAAELSQQPKALLAYQKKMNLKVRQLRLNRLYQQRQQEDKAWLAWQRAYTPPKGLFVDDAAFAHARKYVRQEFETHMDHTWSLAQYYAQQDQPELAWLYADAFLRLSPGDKKAQDLKNAMKNAVPHGFVFPTEQRPKPKRKTIKLAKQTVQAKDVEALMQQGKWVEAKQKALMLRETDATAADPLLHDIQAQIAVIAESAYQAGNIAFREENIDDAVKHWQQAVRLKPDEQTYVDSLRRGKQIQERLKALKAEEK